MTFLSDLCGETSRGKVADFVQDIISPGIRGEAGAEQLKSAEIQEITERSQAIFMKLARNSPLLRGDLAMIAGRTNNRLLQ